VDEDLPGIATTGRLNSKSKCVFRQNRLVRELAKICREELIREKWLIAPSLRVGQQWLDRVALDGRPVLNARVKTFKVLAIELAAQEMARNGFSLVSNSASLIIVDRIIDRLAEKSATYISSLPKSMGLCSLILSAITSLRLAGVGSERLEPSCFEEPAKAQDLIYILNEYLLALRRKNFVDYAEALRIAAQRPSLESWLGASDAILLVPEDLDLAALERGLLENIPRIRVRYLAVDQPAGKDKAESPIETDLSLLRWLGAPEQAPKPLDDGSVRIFHAVGEINEVREALRRCIANGYKLDQVELLYTDRDTYAPLIYETFLRARQCDRADEFHVPVTFADGIPTRYSRPGRALIGWIEWIRSDYTQTILTQMMRDGLLELPHICQEQVEFAHAADQLLQVGIGFGRDRYIEKLNERISELEERLAASRDQADNRSTIDDIAAIQAVRAVVEDLLSITKEAETAQKGIINAAAQLISRIARSPDEFDNYSRRALLDRIEEMAACLAEEDETIAIDLWEWLLTLPHEVRVAGSGPRPGQLHCANILSGGHSGREHTFIIGLDDKRFPGTGLNDPLLLDSERSRLSGDLPTASDRLRRGWEQFVLLLARLRGTVALSFSGLDLSEGRAMFPSSAILSAYRIISGVREGDQSDLMQWLSLPASFAPLAADRCLDRAEWWLWRTCGEEKIGSSEEILGEHFPDLMSGLQTRRNRQGPEFTIYDGLLSDECPELDPTSPSGPIVSAAMLEAIGQCPLKYFFRYVLKIRAPDELTVEPTRWLEPATFGDLLHEVLHQFMSELMSQGRLPSFKRDIARLTAILEYHIARYRKLYPPPGPSAFRIQEMQLQRAIRIFLAEEELLCRGSVPRFLEVSIGMASRFGPTDLDMDQPVVLKLPNGQNIRARGRLDRVDEIIEGPGGSFAVHDYKSGSTYKYVRPDPYWQGRVIQHALYLRMAAALLTGKAARGAKTIQFEYFFPNMRARGLRIKWRAEQLASASDIIQKLCAIPRRGCFLPTTDCDADCAFCDYIFICRDIKSVSAGAQLKLQNPGNTMLGPIRELRQIEIDEP